MAAIEPLIQRKSLDDSLIIDLLKAKINVQSTKYDPDLDTFFFYLMCPDGLPIAIFYINDHIAYIVDQDTQKVIGFLVEDFAIFASKSAELKNRHYSRKTAKISFADDFQYVAKESNFIAKTVAMAASTH